jgi:hypothetical protein
MSSHRYWRIRVIDTEDGSSARIAKLELRGSSGGADLTGSGTAFTAGTATGADNAFDNNAGTYWYSGDGIDVLPEILGYDFGSGDDETVVQVAITADNSTGGGDYAPEDFTIQYSDNGSSWTTAATVTGESPWSDGETRTFATGFSPPAYEYGTATLTLDHVATQSGDASLTLEHVPAEFGQATLTLDHVATQSGAVSLTLSHLVQQSGTATLTLEHVPEPVTGVVGITLYHWVTQTGAPTLGIEHNVVPITGSVSLTLKHQPASTGQASLTVEYRPQAESAGKQWQLKVWLDGVDVTEQITGQVRIEANKGAARLADFVFRPFAGPLDPQAYVKKAVVIDYLTYSSGTLQTHHRRFTGIVDEATFDPVTRLVDFVCTDNLQGSLEAQDFTLIDDWVGGFHSDAVFDETDDGWEYAQQRMSTQPASLDKDVNGQLRKWSWEAKASPDITVTDGDVVDGSIGLTQNTSRDVVNHVDIEFSFAYGRLWQREVRAYWSYNRAFRDYLVLSSDLPNREMFISAIDKSWWVKSLAFTPLPPSGTYDTDSGPVNWVINDALRSSLIIGANAVLAKRWVQDVEEDYLITVTAPASIARFGEAKQVNRYAYQIPIDDSFEQVQQSTPALNEYGSLSTSSYLPPPAGAERVGDDYYLDDDKRSQFNEAIKTVQAIATTDILRSHHQNEVTVTTLLNPYVDIGQTVAVDTAPIDATGTLGQMVEVYDIDAGRAHSTLSVNVFAPDVADQNDDGITLPAQPATEPDEADTDMDLQTYLGGSDVTVPHDPDWRGFLGNLAGLRTFNAVTYPHEFRIETPDVGDDFREQQVYSATHETEVAIPQETLSIFVVDNASGFNYLIPTTQLTPTTEMSDYG